MTGEGEGPGPVHRQLWRIARMGQPKNYLQAASMAFIAAVAPESE